MSGHDGCGCGHGHAEAMETTAVVEQLPVTEESCGDNCGCSHESPFGEVEGATLQGFLTGLYASTMDHAALTAYFQAMGNEEGSPFAKPAQMLADALATVPAQGDKPAHVRLLETVSGESI